MRMAVETSIKARAVVEERGAMNPAACIAYNLSWVKIERRPPYREAALNGRIGISFPVLVTEKVARANAETLCINISRRLRFLRPTYSSLRSRLQTG